jgi:hypothetical protein
VRIRPVFVGIDLGVDLCTARLAREEADMTKYLAGILSVIAIGVLLVAYGLLNPRSAIVGMDGMRQETLPTQLGQPVTLRESLTGQLPGAYMPAGAYGYVPAGYVPAGYVPAGYVVDRSGVPAAPPYVPYATPAVMTTTTEPRAVRTAETAQPLRRPTRQVETQPKRDWKRTALIIGGSSATGAGVGAIFGGKKGALIGAAIGGGASTIYETVK